MKRLLYFFIGIALLGITFALLFFAGTLFDAADRRRIDAFVFQPNDLSVDRIGRPISADELSDTYIREKLIKKFVYEYFYATPDVENIARRTRNDSVLAIMSAPDVFENWKDTTGAELETMATNKMFRTVEITDEITMPTGGDYFVVMYKLNTWAKPNDISLTPTVSTGIMYMRVSFERGLRGEPFNVQKYLDAGYDPAGIFKFRVDEIR